LKRTDRDAQYIINRKEIEDKEEGIMKSNNRHILTSLVIAPCQLRKNLDISREQSIIELIIRNCKDDAHMT